MFEIIATIFYTSNLLAFNNSLHFNVCGMPNDANYIYLDSNEILFGVVEDRSIAHYNYSLSDICNQSISSWESVEIPTTDDNMVVTQIPQYTVTRLQNDNPMMQNLTHDVFISDGKCSLQHYSFMFIAAVTFLIGLILQPDTIYESLRSHFREQLIDAGNDFQESETSFRIYI